MQFFSNTTVLGVWSHRMHPVTLKLELSHSSGDSRKMAHHGDCPLTLQGFQLYRKLVVKTRKLKKT